MHGLLLIDKPPGMTSHDVVRQIRRLYRTRKVGHAGTLDPIATGVLPVAVGDGTKILQFLLAENKSYRATFELGTTTDTLDVEGQILLQRPVPEFLTSELESVCHGFRGTTEQLPPMFSALKKNGVPLYKLARQGKEVERETRKIHISRLEILSAQSGSITIEVDCSKGTYIRSLVSDIGEALGCGAHLTALCRLSSAGFSLDECHRLEDLQALDDPSSALISLSDALRNYPLAGLTRPAVDAIKFGIPPLLSQTCGDGPLASGDLVRLHDNEQLVAVARFAPERVKEQRGDFELIRVFVSH
ncbi:MAG: tRNA pseudouridine(55) synthase TruB [Deltaproteobacteria bacterium]|nr:tRNA pseudouridine(55) synthase TruB [Deltaproteobacteria bacterium]